ncbi:hypothetical protein C8F04DRAFT_1093056 [Mycena alexandri]|uniref:Uncharacterized protein n=1 Tax=Mycena alexandri TaxID=1745969 RepID=A0AAD6X705_9AGAR|nr:hypothetical protein C8F04DRAFT_1093056 [Mycena alexandri]
MHDAGFSGGFSLSTYTPHKLPFASHCLLVPSSASFPSHRSTATCTPPACVAAASGPVDPSSSHPPFPARECDSRAWSVALHSKCPHLLVFVCTTSRPRQSPASYTTHPLLFSSLLVPHRPRSNLPSIDDIPHPHVTSQFGYLSGIRELFVAIAFGAGAEALGGAAAGVVDGYAKMEMRRRDNGYQQGTVTCCAAKQPQTAHFAPRGRAASGSKSRKNSPQFWVH